MKTLLLFRNRTAATMLATALSLSASAQINPIKHLLNESNRSLDYLRSSNSYLLSNEITPATVGGMPAATLLTGAPSPRMHLQVCPDALTTSTLSKTYCTAYEVGLVTSHECNTLSTAFRPQDARRTADGGYIMCGIAVRTFEFSNCNVGPSYADGFLLRTDAAGTPLWYKRYENAAGASYRFNTVIQDSVTRNFIVGGSGGFIMGTDSNGTPLWQHQVTGYLQGGVYSQTPAGPQYSRVCRYIDPSAPQQVYYVLTGAIAYTDHYVSSHASFGGGMLTVVNTAGMVFNNVQLTQDVQATPRFLQLFGVDDAHDGDVVMTGSVGGAYCGQHDANNTVLLKINPLNTAISFMKMYENSAGVCQAGGSCAVVGASAGLAVTTNGYSGSNIYVSGSGDVNGGGQYIGATYLETDNYGNIVRYVNHDSATGWYGGSIVYNSGGGYPVYSGLSSSNKSLVVRHRNAAPNTDCHPDASVVVTDLLPDMVPNDMNPEMLQAIPEPMMSYNLPSAISHYCGATRRDAEPAAVPVLERQRDLTVVPNPARGAIEVLLPASVVNGMAHIYDLQGRAVQTQAFGGTQSALHFNTAGLAPGLYSVSIQDEAGVVRHATFVKE